jgi:hypothetical protein
MNIRLGVVVAAAGLLTIGSLATARTASRPGVVGISFGCLDAKQRAFVVTEIDRGRTGSVVFRNSSIKAGCFVTSTRAAAMAPCGVGRKPFATGCVLTAFKGKHYGGGDMVSIINPDSMRPEDLVGANPTPHP